MSINAPPHSSKISHKKKSSSVSSPRNGLGLKESKRSSSRKESSSQNVEDFFDWTIADTSGGLQPPATLYDELDWGLSYRTFTKGAGKFPLKPKHSPINVPFKLCRAEERGRLKKKKKKCKCKHEKTAVQQLSLLDRSALSQRKYMELLAIPHDYDKKSRKKKKTKRKKCCKCLIEPCPPRLVQMSVPNKIRVLETWKCYQDLLPAETLLRFDDILRSGNDSLEPRDARYYFKQLDKAKRKERKKKKCLQKLKKEIKRKGDTTWVNNQIKETVAAILCQIKKQPMLALNYDQLMLSDELLRCFQQFKAIKIPKRTTKRVYKKTIIEISDKLANWMDGLSHSVAAKPLNSEEELAIAAISSLESFYDYGEEEGSEFGESGYSGESEGEEDVDYSEDEGEGENGSNFEAFLAKKLVDKAGLFDVLAESEDSSMDFLNQYSEDMLAKLIKVLANCPPGVLEQEIDAANWPGVKYGDILSKLEELKEGKEPVSGRGQQIADIMLEWAKKNEPDQVDDPLVDKINETSAILAEWLRSGADFSDTAREGKDQLEPVAEEATEAIDSPKLEFGPSAGEDAALLTDQILLQGIEVAEEGAAGEEGGEEDTTGEDSDLEGREETTTDEGLTDTELLTGGETIGEEEEELINGEEEEALEEEELGEGFATEGEGLEKGGLEGGSRGESIPVTDSELERKRKLIMEMEGLTDEERAAALKALEEGRFDSSMSRESLLNIIRGHKPSIVFEHAPDTICCLSLKLWAIWLLDIAHNAHNWTRWITDLIRQVRQYAAIVRGDVLLPNGETRVLYKDEWRKFTKDTEEKIIAWRQYSKHVKDLSEEIVSTFHGKKVTCCPKCLQDNMIKNVVTAHETLRALTEAISCADYWQRCLDQIVEQTGQLTDIELREQEAAMKTQLSEESFDIVEIVELAEMPQPRSNVNAEESDESLYEIEELELGNF